MPAAVLYLVKLSLMCSYTHIMYITCTDVMRMTVAVTMTLEGLAAVEI